MSGKQSKSLDEEYLEYNIPATDESGKELSKNARKKLLVKAKKEARKANDEKKNETAQAKKQEAEDTSKGKYGEKERIQSKDRPGNKFVDLGNLSAANDGETVLFRARVHNLRPQAKMIFVVFRQRCFSIQGICLKQNCSAQMLKFIQGVNSEAVVDVTGKLVKTDQEIKCASQKDVEIQVTEFFIVSNSLPVLPLLLEDAERPYPLVAAQKVEIKAIEKQIESCKAKLADANAEQTAEIEKQLAKLIADKDAATKFVVVKKKTRLDNRFIDLRTSANQAMLRIKSGVCMLFREFLYSRDFTEIQSPKLIGTASEGGANVFKLGYFGTDAFLAQSPQLYKQMAISSDLNRVFEVGPVFRAENSKTKRHMTEFIGLDMEMAFYEHYHEVLEVLSDMFIFIFDGLKERFSVEIERIREQYPFEDLKYKKPSLILKWPEAIALLRENGIEIGDFEDFSLEVEKTLGNLVRDKYDTDFFMLDKFPLEIRPFYTMPDPVDPRYSNSYDFFIRGQEIVSGAQRIHDPELLLQQATKHEVDIAKISDYIDCFKYGAFPHAGAGVGLERVVMLYLNLPSVQLVSMFPRTPQRLRP